MKIVRVKSRTKRLVISGYILVVFIMILGLWALYINLVDFSEKRVKNEDRKELIIVSNIINQLYEAETSYDLLSFENTEKYIESFVNKRPLVSLRLDSLKQLTNDTIRIAQLDSIDILLDEKEENLEAVFSLMDSLRKSPSIIKESKNTFSSKNKVDDFVKKQVIEETIDSDTDTTIIVGKKKGLIKRLGDAFAGRQDSVVIVEKHPTQVVRQDYQVVVDTILNMVRYTERLDLQNRQKFQIELSNRQAAMNATNQILTARVDMLLKNIEQEEVEKAIQLIEDKEKTLGHSLNIVSWVSIVAFLIAVIFGLMFIIDINKSQRYKRRLEESNEHINRLLKSREKLMLSISHDIKSPMGSILGYIELIESNTNVDLHDEYLLNMKKSSEHILQLVTNLLDYQRLESNTWTRKEMDFSLRELVATTAESFAPLCNKKNITFEVNNNVPKNLIVNGDPFMLREIYSNIISNAVKYTFEGGVVVNISLDEDTKNIYLSVKDTGVGIAEENHSRIFNEFEQIAPDNLESFSEGTGLGLTITKGLVMQVNGDISFESEKGVGTEFLVRLPVTVSSKVAEETVKTKCKNTTDLRLDGISVLLIDDDPIQLTMASAMLKKQNINIVTESNSSKVLNILSKQSFDIIFCDIQMPEINGFFVVKQIIDSGVLKENNTPIIALTATSELNEKDYQESGFTAYLNKPYSSSQLFDTIIKNINAKSSKPKSDCNNDESSFNSKGIEALISYVRDDEESVRAILKSFVDECVSLNNFLKSENIKSDNKYASNFAHKMLPIFQMIGDKPIIANIMELEKKGVLRDKDLKDTIERIDYYIESAKEELKSIK